MLSYDETLFLVKKFQRYRLHALKIASVPKCWQCDLKMEFTFIIAGDIGAITLFVK